jgi:hypothetical protein
MAQRSLSTVIRKRLYIFARRLASPFADYHWPQGGSTARCAVWLPEVSEQTFWLVVHWRWTHSERPLVLLVRPRDGPGGRDVGSSRRTGVAGG